MNDKPDNSPFASSPLTRRSPTGPSVITRRQLKHITALSATQEKNARKPSSSQDTVNTIQDSIRPTTPNNIAQEEETKTRAPTATGNTQTEDITETRGTDTPQQNTEQAETSTTKMNAQQIQQSISSCVPEFNGENESQRQNELTRFLGTADSIYESLGTEAEKKIFNKLIKFRLTGDAYTRINRRQIEDYKTLSKTLTDMYTQVYSLVELEKNMLEIRQNYGETVRSFGYRLCEALDQYKKNYRIKYKLNSIDETYSKHLDLTAVQTFKRGLNNIILKEKIATHNACQVEEILDETETIEKMLLMATDLPSIQPQVQQGIHNQQPYGYQQVNYMRQRAQVICNYCQKPNHSWDICRSRINDERRKQHTQYQTTAHQVNNQYTANIPQHTYKPNYYAGQQTDYRLYPPVNPNTAQNQYNTPHSRRISTAYPQRNNFFNGENKYATQQRSPNSYSQQGNGWNFQNRPSTEMNYVNQQHQRSSNNFMNTPPKYCSYCKVTKGHTFDECKNKLRDGWRGNPQNVNTQQNQSGNDDLEAKFSNMRINTITPHVRLNYNTPATNEQTPHQENFVGSSQL